MARRRRPRRRSWAVLLVAGCVLAGTLWLLWREDRPPAPQPDEWLTGPEATPDTFEEDPPRAPANVPRVDAVSSEPPGHVALVIDDLGRSLDELRAVSDLGITVTYAVLPYESRTREVVEALRLEGREMLLHLPMEPSNGSDPGPGALTGRMGPGDLARATRAALARVPAAVGVNNHMGSELTEDAASMRAVMGVLAAEGLFFLDSRTSPDSTAYRVAREHGIASTERHVFLDAVEEADAIRGEVARLLAFASERGAAVGIAHPRPRTLEVLAEEVPRALERGYEFVPVSFLLERTAVPHGD